MVLYYRSWKYYFFMWIYSGQYFEKKVFEKYWIKIHFEKASTLLLVFKFAKSVLNVRYQTPRNPFFLSVVWPQFTKQSLVIQCESIGMTKYTIKSNENSGIHCKLKLRNFKTESYFVLQLAWRLYKTQFPTKNF